MYERKLIMKQSQDQKQRHDDLQTDLEADLEWEDLPSRDVDSDPSAPAGIDWEDEDISITGSTYSGEYGPVQSMAEYRKMIDRINKSDQRYKPPHVFGRRADKD